MESTIDITKYLLHSTIEEVISSDTECSETSSIIGTDDYYLNTEKLVSYLSFNRTTQLLQDKLSSQSKEVIALIIDNLKGNYKSLFYGKNSNYFISDLIIKANKSQKIQIIKEIQKELYKMCFNEFASHPVQTLIEKHQVKKK